MNWALFNWVDWVIIGIVTLSTLLSLVRGFAREAMSLGAWVLAFVIGNMFVGPVASLLTGAIDNVTARYVAAFVILFVGTLVAANVLILVTGRVISLSGLTTLDRLLGTVFGFARGLIVVLVLVFVVRELVAPAQRQWLHQAQLMPHLEMMLQWAREIFSQLDTGAIPGIPI